MQKNKGLIKGEILDSGNACAGICKLLEWDTAFFGIRIARIILPRLTAKGLQEVFSWCYAQRIACLYFLSDCDHAESIHLAEKNGFSLVDVRMTFESKMNKSYLASLAQPDRVSIRLSRPDDIPYLKKIAKNIYHNTRFYHDPHFSKKQIDKLYMNWIEKSCRGYANAVLVLTERDKVAGYITCNITDPKTGNIGLLGLDPLLQGAGLGRYLVLSALQWFSKQGVDFVEVVTQARNIKSQRLYQRCGLLVKGVHLWYHKWFNI